MPIIGATLYIIIRKAYPVFERVFKKYDDLNNVVEENTSGIRVVKSYLLEESEKKKFGKISQDIYKDFSKAQKLMSLTNPVMQFAMYLAIILISWFGARIIVATNMSELEVGQLTSLITYGIRLLTSLMMLAMLLVMSTMARNSAERIYEILIEKPDLKNPKKPIKDVKDGSIEFKNVSFSYVGNKKKECLKDINLKIKSGETVGIIGGIGSGKSSLVNLIPRLYDATEGTVLVGGKNVKQYDIETLRNEVSVVLQKNVLFSGTIKENLRWGNKNASDEELINACKLAQADEFITQFPNGYDTVIDQGGANVSGGQKQRLCIARAIISSPKVLILDDSTSAVDMKTDALLRAAFRKAIPDTTKIIIAQRVASVMDADKIVIMNNGKIDDVGTHEELLERSEIYREVYTSQNKTASAEGGNE